MWERPYEHLCEVQFSDIDLNGHVHHLAYLRYAEAARVHALASLGAGPRVLSDAGCVVAVLSLEVSYMAAVSFGEAVRATALYGFGDGKSFSCSQRIHGDRSGEAAGLQLVLGLLDTGRGRLVADPESRLRELAGLA